MGGAYKQPLKSAGQDASSPANRTEPCCLRREGEGLVMAGDQARPLKVTSPLSQKYEQLRLMDSFSWNTREVGFWEGGMTRQEN